MTGHELEPASVLDAAITQLHTDGHDQLADDLARIQAYYKQLAVAQTEIVMASDALLHKTPHLLRREQDTPPDP